MSEEQKKLKQKFETLSQEQMVDYLMKYYAKINQLEYEKMKILLIAKPFFDAVMNIDISKIKNLGLMDITKIATELMKITEDNSGSWKDKLNVFKTQEEKKDTDLKELIIKASQILKKHGISIEVEQALLTKKEDLEFIHQLLTNI